MASKTADQLSSADYYADSYAHFGIHEEMLKDSVRTRTYMQAILQNPHLFKGKSVLDVGCGTGILSMFAARAGARAVYAVDMSSIAKQAQEIVRDNGFQDTITVYHAKMEDVQLPEQVDIIVSEWMGYALMYESMLPTVLVARDRWLKPGGHIMPDRSEIFVAGIEDKDYKEEKIEFWSNVYGFKMNPIKKMALQEPLVDTVSSSLLVTNGARLVSFDLHTITAADVVFDSPFALVAQQDDYLHALVLWFSVHFDCTHTRVSFSTSPEDKVTHWKHTVFYLEDTITIAKGEVFRGRLKCKPSGNNPRDLEYELSYTFQGSLCTSDAVLHYLMR